MDTKTATIREYCAGSEADATAFRVLNEEWLTRYFVVEADDRTVLDDPKGQVLDRGGTILFAEAAGEIAGCCALIPQADGAQSFEIAKLAVTAAFQGRGMGRRLMEASITKARASGAKRVILVTNSGLSAARSLYESLNFSYLTPEQAGALGHYQRGDTFMELLLC